MKGRSLAAWAVVIASCLCCGALLTVAVAWAGILWGPFPTLVLPGDHVWQMPVRDGWPARPDTVFRSSSLFIEGWVCHATEPNAVSGMEKGWHQSVLGAGWPMAALEWDLWAEQTGGRIDANQWRGRWDISRSPVPTSNEPRDWLPTRPMWLGLLVDSAVWGVVSLCMLSLGWWVAVGRRQWSRRRRGACLACGYDLRGVAGAVVCPECGAAR